EANQPAAAAGGSDILRRLEAVEAGDDFVHRLSEQFDQEVLEEVKWSIESGTHVRTVDVAVDHALIDVVHELSRGPWATQGHANYAERTVHAARLRIIRGRWRRPHWNLTLIPSRTPGCPLTSTCGLAQAEPPSRAWFEAGHSASRPPTKIHFVGCRSGKGRVRPRRVIPTTVELQFPAQRAAQQRHHRHDSRALLLERAQEPFHHGDTALLAHPPETLAHALNAAPALEGSAVELLTLVRPQVAGSSTDTSHHPAEKAPDLLRSRLLGKNRNPVDPTREMIQDHGQPPAKGPALRQGEWAPRGPKAGRCGYGGEVDMPQMVRVLGGHPTSARHRLQGMGRRRPFAPHAPRRC